MLRPPSQNPRTAAIISALGFVFALAVIAYAIHGSITHAQEPEAPTSRNIPHPLTCPDTDDLHFHADYLQGLIDQASEQEKRLYDLIEEVNESFHP